MPSGDGPGSERPARSPRDRPDADLVARVVVEVAPAHLDRPFDYRAPRDADVGVGQRVRVPFAGRTRSGWVVDTASSSDTPAAQLKTLASADETTRWFDAAELRAYRWVAHRYAATLAAVLRHAVPPRVAVVQRELAAEGPPPSPQRALRPPCPASAWRPYPASPLLRAVAAPSPAGQTPPAFWLQPLPGDDEATMVADLVARCLAAGRAALVLTPEPSSAVADAVLALAGAAGADLRIDPPKTTRPGAGDAGSVNRRRYRSAMRCRSGHATVAVGERGAALAPLADLGLVVVVDEANPAYKEQRSPRFSAREVALSRARFAGAVAVLTGDLPSAALWRLLSAGHVTPVVADRAVQRERAPRVDVVDLADPRPGARRARLSPPAARAVGNAVRVGGAAAVLVARRGDGTVLACRRCGTRRACPVCDGALHRETAALACATCGWRGPDAPCAACGASDDAPLVAGAGRLASELARSHPDADVARMEGFDAPGPSRRPAVGVMTRGSVVTRPGWLGAGPADVVVVPDADALLGRPRFDAAEDALRLWMAAGHWTRHLVVQTREPAAAAVQALVRWDAPGFWRREEQRRAELSWPPHRNLVRLDVPVASAPKVAAQLRAGLPPGDEVLGPDADGSLLVKTADLHGTLDALTPLRCDWGRSSVGVRVDVDPL